jgi:hypothetical protein
MAILGALSGVGLIIGIVLIILGKIKKKKYYGGLITIIALVIFIFAIANTPTDDEEASTPDVENKTDQNYTWQEKVKAVATKDATETEKFDEISLFAMDYQPTEEEIKEFEDFIINEYKSGNYIKDLTNHEYMLSNIFKSQVVERYYDEGEPMKDFAFDFWQNSKYTYRGVDTPDSTPVKSNEDQMNKALEKMGK